MAPTAEQPTPPRFAGFPPSAWAFALRNWSAMMLALYVAFWLQIDGASSAATCVGILSLPTRGQMLQKAAYRIAGTIIGLVASFAIAGLFNELRDLLLIASAAWISLCVFAACLLDGNRAYAAVLSGYTVAIVTISNIDSPQDVFEAGANRGAASTIGTLAIAFTSELIFTPDIFPKVLGAVEAARCKVRAFAHASLRRGASDPVEVAALLGEITALRPDTTLLRLEQFVGDTRSAAARAVGVSMVHQVRAARYVAPTLAEIGDPVESFRNELAEAMHDAPGGHADGLLRRIQAAFAGRGLDPRRLVAAAASLVLLERDGLATAALEGMRSGREQRHRLRLPIWRSRAGAARSALRTFVALVATTSLLVAFSGWPSTSGALEAFAAVLGISATNANPISVASGALIAAPLAALAAGITEFVLLDGADQFPLLALAMAPTVIGASLMAKTGKPKLAATGTLLLVLFPIVLSPANPQSYDAEAFLSGSVLLVLAIVLLFVCLATILPTDDALRRRWIMRSSWDEFRQATQGRFGHHGTSEAAYRDADRIAQLGKLKDKDKEAHELSVRRALRLSDVAACARRIYDLLADPQAMLPPEAAQARSALAALDPGRLRVAADAVLDRLQGSPSQLSTRPQQAAAELVLAAVLVERYSSEVKGQPPQDARPPDGSPPGTEGPLPSGPVQER